MRRASPRPIGDRENFGAREPRLAILDGVILHVRRQRAAYGLLGRTGPRVHGRVGEQPDGVLGREQLVEGDLPLVGFHRQTHHLVDLDRVGGVISYRSW